MPHVVLVRIFERCPPMVPIRLARQANHVSAILFVHVGHDRIATQFERNMGLR